jgi:hypothetical protein
MDEKERIKKLNQAIDQFIDALGSLTDSIATAGKAAGELLIVCRDIQDIRDQSQKQ